jgi:hypothetical protein
VESFSEKSPQLSFRGRCIHGSVPRGTHQSFRAMGTRRTDLSGTRVALHAGKLLVLDLAYPEKVFRVEHSRALHKGSPCSILTRRLGARQDRIYTPCSLVALTIKRRLDYQEVKSAKARQTPGGIRQAPLFLRLPSTTKFSCVPRGTFQIRPRSSPAPLCSTWNTLRFSCVSVEMQVEISANWF